MRAAFNPSQSSLVDELKSHASNFIDRVNEIASASNDGEVKRCCALAMTEIETAAMYAVKAATA